MAYIYDLTDTWNAGGTTFNAIKMNVTDSASAAASKLVTLQTNGTEHFSVTKAGVGYFSGNVGIGTSSPGAKLDVAGLIYASNGMRSTAAQPISVYTGTADAQRMEILTSGTDGVLRATRSSGTIPNMLFRIDSNEAMRITSAGNVGIGTSAPGARLHIVNSDLASQLRLQHVTTDVTRKYGVIASGHYTNAEEGLSLITGDSGLSANAVYIGGGVSTLNAASTIAFYTAANNTTTTGTERMRITSDGNMTVGSTSSFARLASVAADGTYQLALVGTSKAVRMRSDTTNFKIEAVDQTLSSSYEPLWLSGSLIQFGTSTTERMRIDSSGNVGIGTSSPQQKFVVSNGGAGGIEIIPTGVIQSFNRSASAYQAINYDASTHAFRIGVSEAARIDSSGNVGIGATSPANKLHVAGGAVRISDATNSTAVLIDASTTGGLTSITTQFGGSSLALGSAATERLRIKSSGGVRYIPLASAPSSPEAGEVYYDSTTNKLRCYNGTTWNDLF